ncbi:hypothetical protein PpBr36_01815 [Pyricularia pennisetigena]|uniref:hypothetical protein n=1 Tax=Pyricularia pennisetigena TaxID=1578925 RepID=UPI001151E56E|nr:hypothetical protein PpBr36_01815 [Pyricularia pennisetigena]TLS28546.1 hypothetical protein PpBr36_01815 [Pyricularia pennisetigena]
MHDKTCPKCGAASDGSSKTCGSCGAVSHDKKRPFPLETGQSIKSITYYYITARVYAARLCFFLFLFRD